VFVFTWMLSLCLICFCSLPFTLKLQISPASNLISTNVSRDIQIMLAVICVPPGGSRDRNKSPLSVCSRQGPSRNKKNWHVTVMVRIKQDQCSQAYSLYNGNLTKLNYFYCSKPVFKEYYLLLQFHGFGKMWILMFLLFIAL